MENKTSLLTSNHHHGHSEDFLPVCCGRDVTEADACQAGHSEVQGGDVDGVLVGPTLPLPWTAGVETVWRAHRLGQDVQPAVCTNDVGLLVDNFIITDAVPVEVGGGVKENNWKYCTPSAMC